MYYEYKGWYAYLEEKGEDVKVYLYDNNGHFYKEKLISSDGLFITAFINEPINKVTLDMAKSYVNAWVDQRLERR